MDVTLLLKGLAIGLVFGVPVGAVGALTVQRAVEHGSRAGLVSGLGCAAADAVYAMLSVFGLTFVATFLEEYRDVIGLVGGIVLVVLGVFIGRQRPAPAHVVRKEARLPAFFCSSFAIAASSPSTVFMFLFAFSVFGVGDPGSLLNGLLIVVGITVGASLWWVLVAWVAGSLRTRVTRASMCVCNRVCGVFIAAFGLLSALRPLFL